MYLNLLKLSFLTNLIVIVFFPLQKIDLNFKSIIGLTIEYDLSKIIQKQHIDINKPKF